MTQLRRSTVAALAAALLLLAASAGRARASQSVRLSAGLQSLYDTNLLEYSDAQLARFEAGTHPEQFSLDTRDDLVWGPYLTFNWEQRMRRERRRGLRLRGEGDFHQKNGTADFRSASLGWREWFPGDRRLALSWYVLPRYYLRQLFDQDLAVPYPGLAPLRYGRAEFRLMIGSAGWSQRLTDRTRGEISYQYERRNYNASFDERDSDTHQGEIGITWSRLPRRGSLALGGGYQTSQARAGTSIDPVDHKPFFLPDLSYHGILASIGGGMELRRIGRVRLSSDFAYTFETRAFDTDHPEDRYHYKRHDRLHVIEAGVRTVYRPHWAVRGMYRFEDNRAGLGTSAPPSADAGSYRVHQVAVTIEWSGALWRSRSAPDDSEGEP